MKCLSNLFLPILIQLIDPSYGAFQIYGGSNNRARNVETRPFTPVRADVKREFGIKKPLVVERPPTRAPAAAPAPQNSRSFPSRSFNAQKEPSSSGPSFQTSSGPTAAGSLSKVSKPATSGSWKPSSWSSARKPSSPHHGPSFRELGKLGGGIEVPRSSDFGNTASSSFANRQTQSNSFSFTSSVSEETGWKGVSQSQPTASSFDRLDRFMPQENIRRPEAVNTIQSREPQGLPSWNGNNDWDQGGTPAPTGPSWRTTRATLPPTTQSTRLFAPTTRSPISFQTQKFQFDSNSRLESARKQLLLQSQQNERMSEARSSNTFLERYSSGPQQSAGFSSNGNGDRSLLNYQNSYRAEDVRSGMVAASSGQVRIEKPPEVRTTGNPFDAEVSDQWEGETEGAIYHGMGEKDRQEYKNKNPDKWADLDGDGVLEFDPDMPDYPAYKFFTETRWESDTDGGYIGILYVPITRDVDGWSITLKFSMPVTKLENWEYSPTVQSPSDGVTCMLHNNHWNGVRLQGTQMRIRIMVEFDRTPGMPPGMIPQPAAALLGTIWYPDGSNANYDEGISRNTVSYNEGFSNLPKPETASNVKSYTDPVNERLEQANSQGENIKWNNAAMFQDNYRSQLSWLDTPLFGGEPTEAPKPSTTADPYAGLSSNLIKGRTTPNQINFSGNLAGVSGISSTAQKTLDEIAMRLRMLEENTQTDIIMNAFGEVRTTRSTTTTTIVATTKRTLTMCEKRSIAEKRMCKQPSCFRHMCLENGDFSPSQCWPKVGLCWCVTIDGLKLSTTIRKMIKFKSSSCQLTYDPTGIAASREVTTAGELSNPQQSHGSSYENTGYTMSSSSQSYDEAPGMVEKNNNNSERENFYLKRVTEAPTPRPTVKYDRYSKHDWSQVIKLSSQFYFAQMSGKLPIDHPVRWRLSAHENDGRPCGVDLSGGFYDSGDFMKYTFPMAWTMTMLSWGAIEHRSTLENVGRWKDLSKIITTGAEYLLKTNPSPRVLYAIVGDPEIDHQYWGRPQDQNSIRPCLKVTQWAHGTDLAAEVAGALAAASMVVSDEALASKCWHKAQELYDFGDKHRGKYSDVVHYYPSNDYTDELGWGAVWLYKASKTEIDKIKYMNRAKSAYTVFQLGKKVESFNWDQKHAGVQLLMAELTNEPKYIADISTFCDYNMPHGGAKYTPGGLLFIEKWGVLRHSLNIAYICLRAGTLMGMDAIRQSNYRKFAMSQLDYMLGGQGRSFLVGYGKNYPDRPHHRTASCSLVGPCSWEAYKNDRPNPQVLMGALVGGPDENDIFVNNRTDFVRNEVALDYNAALTSIAALMLDLERGNVG